MLKGIDISEHNGDINLSKIKPEFVIIRAGVGTRLDYRVHDNILKCERLGIPYGFYWYTYAINPVGTDREATKFREFVETILTEEHKPTCGYWLDMEDGDYYKKRNGFEYSYKNINPIISAFKEKFKYEMGVYTSQSWLQYYDYKKYPLWVAWWLANDNGEVPNKDFSDIAVMWQYTSKYLGQPLDGNIMYKELPKPTKQTPKELLFMCIDTLDGMYGVDAERKEKLGRYYDNVQEIINLAYKLSYR